MGRKSIKNERQKEIVEVFYKVAIREGLENTSIAKIAQEMDVNPSLIIHYFKTKDDLIASLIDFILEKYSTIFAVKGKNKSATERLELLIDRLFSRKWNDLFDDSVYYSCFALVLRNDRLREKYKNLHDSLRVSLAEILEEGKHDGLLQLDDAKKTSELIFGLLEGAYYYMSLVKDKNEYTEKLSYFKEEACKILNLQASQAESLSS
jgi:AcrR family transcriptional regulator